MDKTADLEKIVASAQAAEKKPRDWDKICFILVCVAAGLLLLLVLLQVLEIDSYDLFPAIGERLASLFQ